MKSKKNFVIGLFIICFLVLTIFLYKYFKQEIKNLNFKKYELYNVRKEPNLVLKGKVSPTNIQIENYSLSKGQISNIMFNNEQFVFKGDNLISYLNTDNMFYLEKKNRELKKLNYDKDRLLSEEEDLIKEIDNLDKEINELEFKIEEIKNKNQYEDKNVDKTISDNLSNAYSFELNSYTVEFNSLIAKKEALISNKKNLLVNIQELVYRIEDIEYEIENKKDSYENIIVAEFDGVIQKFISDINTVPNDGIIFRLLSKQKKIVSKISEFDYDILKVGNEVDISLISDSKKLKGEITKISNIPSNKDMNNEISEYEVEIIPKEDLRYGSTVKLEIKNEKIYIPISSVNTENKEYSVYKYLDQRVERVIVKGNMQGELFEIESGVTPGDSILLNYDSELVDGEYIEVKYD